MRFSESRSRTLLSTYVFNSSRHAETDQSSSQAYTEDGEEVGTTEGSGLPPVGLSVGSGVGTDVGTDVGTVDGSQVP